MLNSLWVILDNSPSLPNKDDYISKIIPNWVSFTAQLAALIVLIIMIILFAYKPVKKIIQKRQDYIESNIHEAEVNNATAHENALKSEEMVLASKREAASIIQNATDQALIERNRIIEETNALVIKMKNDAEADIASSQAEALENIRKEMVSIALDASKEVLGREISEADNSRLIEDFIKETSN